MEISSILAAIDSEIARLKRARAALASESGGEITENGSRPPGKRISVRTFSPEARRRIAEAQKRRWAAARSRVPESVSVLMKAAPVDSDPACEGTNSVPF